MTSDRAILGVQVTLVGVALELFFGGMTAYSLAGLALAAAGTGVVLLDVFPPGAE